MTQTKRKQQQQQQKIKETNKFIYFLMKYEKYFFSC